MKLENYNHSWFTKRKKIQKHSIWWRRLLGQKEEVEEWIRLSYSFKAPEEIIQEDWFQELIQKAALAHGESYYEQLEVSSTASEYVATKANTLIKEEQRTNLLNHTYEPIKRPPSRPKTISYFPGNLEKD